MLKAWKARAALTMPAALDAIGGSWRAKFDADQGLSGAETRAFAKALGLGEEGPMSYSVEGLARLLRSSGPLWVVTDDDFEANKVVHARIVTAMHGDGTVAGTTLTLADPSSGSFVTDTVHQVRAAARGERGGLGRRRRISLVRKTRIVASPMRALCASDRGQTV